MAIPLIYPLPKVNGPPRNNGPEKGWPFWLWGKEKLETFLGRSKILPCQMGNLGLNCPHGGPFLALLFSEEKSKWEKGLKEGFLYLGIPGGPSPIPIGEFFNRIGFCNSLRPLGKIKLLRVCP